MNVLEMVRKHLEEHGFDGLYMTEEDIGGACGCGLDDLAPCGEVHEICKAGYRSGELFGATRN